MGFYLLSLEIIKTFKKVKKIIKKFTQYPIINMKNFKKIMEDL